MRNAEFLVLRSSFQTDDFVRNEYAELINRLKKECQEEFEKTHTHDEFMKLIGRNYL